MIKSIALVFILGFIALIGPKDVYATYIKQCSYEVTPTPTEEIRPTEEVKQENQSTWSPSFPHDEPYVGLVCTGDAPKQPLLQGSTRIASSSVEFRWWPVEDIDYYSLVFGYYGEEMTMGAANINPEATSITIKDLKPNIPVNAQIWAWRNQCVSKSIILDP